MISLDVGAALVVRLQVDQEAAAVERGVGAVDADERGQAVDVGILAGSPSASACWRSAIAANEIDCGASVMPWIRPVSWTGKKPLGIDDVEHARSAPAVATATSSVSGWWSSTQRSARP